MSSLANNISFRLNRLHQVHQWSLEMYRKPQHASQTKNFDNIYKSFYNNNKARNLTRMKKRRKKLDKNDARLQYLEKTHMTYSEDMALMIFNLTCVLCVFYFIYKKKLENESCKK